MKRVRINFFGGIQLAVAGTISLAFLDGLSMVVRGRTTADEHGVLVEQEGSDNMSFAPWSSIRTLNFQRAGRFAIAEETKREAEEAALREEIAKNKRAEKRRRREEADMERLPGPVVVQLQPVKRKQP